MLCNLKDSKRPDKSLQQSLIKLSVVIIFLSATILTFFIFPGYLLYSFIATILLTITCFILTITTLKSGEAAISYGGFANEIIHCSPFAERIENPSKQIIIQNQTAADLLQQENVLNFIKNHLSEGSANKSAFSRLQKALTTLSQEKVILSLLLNQQDTLIFNNLEYFSISVFPIYLKKPKIFNGAFSVKRIKRETYFYWKIENITAKKNIERVLHDELNGLHDFIDEIPIGLYCIDNQSIITYANSNFANFLNIPPQQLIGVKLNKFLANNSIIPLKNDFWFGRICFTNANNEHHEAYIFQTSYRQNEKMLFRGAVIHDIPCLETSKENLSRSLDDTNTLLKNFPIGIVFIDSSGNILNSNTEAVKLFQLNDCKGDNLFTHLTEENQQILQSTFKKKFSSSSNIEIKQNNYSLNCFIHKLNSSADSLDNFIIYIIDVTKQKNLEMQFTQAQKMQAIGQFAGGVAHDFNNLLTALIGFTDLLLQRHGIGDPSFADLIQIKQNANRAASLVRQLLAFARQQPLMPKLIDITENFADLSQMLKRIIGEKIKLVFRHSDDLGYVKVDPNQFAQVIVNLVVNAKDAMNGAGTITISTKTYHLDEKYVFGGDTIPAGEFIEIDVSDNGCGIPPENINRIFDPFFSTKENVIGSGTGLGLAMVYGIIRQTEGFIKVSSVLNQGTTFSIFLPRFEKENDNTQENIIQPVKDSSGKTILKIQETLNAPANINQKIIMGLNVNKSLELSNIAPKQANRKIKILFVEDETAVRLFALRALKKQGYEVVASDSAENALEIIQTDTDFDMLFTDMVLPGISGAQLINKIKSMIPNILVILASGYSEDIARKEVDNSHKFDFIAKPYSLGDLITKVSEVLNKNNDK